MRCSRSSIPVRAGLTGVVAISSFAVSLLKADAFELTKPEVLGTPVCQITIPVELNKVHKDVINGTLLCGIWKTEAESKSFSYATAVGAGKSKIFLRPDPATGYSRRPRRPETVQIFYNSATHTVSDVNQAVFWGCEILFRRKSGLGRPAKSTADTSLKAAARAPFRQRLTGKM